MKVVVIGGGLSGLFHCYFLKKKGLNPTLIEASDRVGGMVQTLNTPFGKIEKAANALLNSHLLEELAQDLELKLLPTKPSAKNRYIYRNGLRRWPLSISETIGAIFKFFWAKRKPLSSESISSWSLRVAGLRFHDYLVEPGLRGIYAGDTKKLSASLILSRFFQKKVSQKKPFLKGSVSFSGGLEDLSTALQRYLKASNVEIKLNCPIESLKTFNPLTPVIISTDAWSAAKILKPSHPKQSAHLSTIEMLPVVTVNLFFEKHRNQKEGFGVLFPKVEKFCSLGVLFEDCIFENRSHYRSERWILGGAQSPDLITLEDQALIKLVLLDRARLSQKSKSIECLIQAQVVRWPKAFPHYTVNLESTLNHASLKSLEDENIYLAGNFSGNLGLTKILENSERLTQKIRDRAPTEVTP